MERPLNRGSAACRLRSAWNGRRALVSRDGGSWVLGRRGFRSVFWRVEFMGKCDGGSPSCKILRSKRRLYRQGIGCGQAALMTSGGENARDSVQIAFGERGTDSVSGLFERFSFFRSARERPCGWFDLGTGSLQSDRKVRLTMRRRSVLIMVSSLRARQLEVGAMETVLVVW